MMTRSCSEGIFATFLLLISVPSLVLSKPLLSDGANGALAFVTRVGRGGGSHEVKNDLHGSESGINNHEDIINKIAVDQRDVLAQHLEEMTNRTSDGYKILHEDVLHYGWRRLIRRRVQYPRSGQVADFEVVGQKGETDQAVLVFCWDTRTKTATLVQEYMPSAHRMMRGLAAGMVEHDKHERSALIAAQHELEEECNMTGGREWILLTPSGTGGVVMDKYSTTRISVYLVLDARPMNEDEKTSRPRDETEEGMQVLHGVRLEQIKRWMAEGRMTIVGSWACLLAFEKLRALGEIGA